MKTQKPSYKVILKKTVNLFFLAGMANNGSTSIKKSIKLKPPQASQKTSDLLHGLRHTYASILASSGQVDMYTLQKLLTHKSPQMTQRYAHLRDETLKRASDLIVDLIPMKEDIAT